MIIWLENPKKWRYLRKSTGHFSTRRFPIKTVGNNIGDFYKLIGYELKAHHSDNLNYAFLFDYYWLKTYDDGCPEVEKCHYNDGGVPCEGILTKDLPNHSATNKENRCLDCTKFGSKRNACFLRKILQSSRQEVSSCESFSPVDKNYPKAR